MCVETPRGKGFAKQVPAPKAEGLSETPEGVQGSAIDIYEYKYKFIYSLFAGAEGASCLLHHHAPPSGPQPWEALPGCREKTRPLVLTQDLGPLWKRPDAPRPRLGVVSALSP